MKTALLAAAAALAISTSAFAQEATSASGSNADASAGSIAGSESNGNVQGQSQANIGGNNAGIGTSRSNSASDSTAVSGSASISGSDQTQGQSSSNSNQLGASNQQGVAVSNTFNSTNRKHSYVGTNTPVMLAASSSFSSDYCGGTASGGASIAPIGISLGGAAPTFDKTCQYLRVAEKAGMLGANYYNAGYKDMAGRAFALEAWATCMAGPSNDKRKKGYEDNHLMEACLALGLLGSSMSPVSPPPAPAPEAAVSDSTGHPTPEAVERYKTPRGALDIPATPTTPSVPVAVASAK